MGRLLLIIAVSGLCVVAAPTALASERLDVNASGVRLAVNGGTALVIHAKPDDMKTDPAGNAGDRIACGIIK